MDNYSVMKNYYSLQVIAWLPQINVLIEEAISFNCFPQIDFFQVFNILEHCVIIESRTYVINKNLQRPSLSPISF